MLFDVGVIEKFYSKRDAFILLDCDKPEFMETSQRCTQKSYFVYKYIPKNVYGVGVKLFHIPRKMLEACVGRLHLIS